MEQQLPHALLLHAGDEGDFARAGIEPDQCVKAVFQNDPGGIGRGVLLPLRVGQDHQLALPGADAADHLGKQVADIPDQFGFGIPRGEDDADPPRFSGAAQRQFGGMLHHVGAAAAARFDDPLAEQRHHRHPGRHLAHVGATGDLPIGGQPPPTGTGVSAM